MVLLEGGWHEKERAFQPEQKEHWRLAVGCVLMEDLPQGQPYALEVVGFAMRKKGSRWTSCEPSQKLQRKKERDEQDCKKRLE